MSKLKVINQEGKEQGSVELNPELFSARVNQRLLDLVLKAYAGNQRRGLAETKTRKDVRGGGKKPWRQKGTGNARQGSIRSPQWRGGGVVFGPHPRSYRTELPKQMKKKAVISALSLKNKDNKVTIIDQIKLAQAKTKDLVKVIDAIEKQGQKSLFVGVQPAEELKRASQNLSRNFKVQNVENINAYDILRKENLIIEKEALPLIEKRILAIQAEEKK